MLGRGNIFLVKLVKPVGIGKGTSIVVPFLVVQVCCSTIIFRLGRIIEFSTLEFQNLFHLLFIKLSLSSVIDGSSIKISGKTIRIYHVRSLCSCAEAHIARVVYSYLARFSATLFVVTKMTPNAALEP